MEEAIAELKSLIRGHRMGINSKIRRPLVYRITKTLIYDKQRKSETDLGIEKVKQALSDFHKQAKNKNDWEEKQYKGRSNQIQEKLKSSKFVKITVIRRGGNKRFRG